jgi:hypothetical protein
MKGILQYLERFVEKQELRMKGTIPHLECFSYSSLPPFVHPSSLV